MKLITNERRSPLIVHPLPGAPAFSGRENELLEMRQFWAGGPGVLSLIGLGGAGKTALAQKFLSWLLDNDAPDAVLVWSFYDDPDANQFLKTAHRYFAGGTASESGGAGWFHLLSEALGGGGRFLLVLDGLERVQRQQTDASGIYGELEDPLLRGLISRLASGAGNAKAIVTSRFPVASAERWLGRGYSVIDVDQLSGDAARALLRAHQVTGEDEDLDRVIADYGGHALTLDLLSGALSKFFGGDPSKAPSSDVSPGAEGAQSARLSRVLQFFEQNLSPRELDLLSRLCVFRFGAELEALTSIFLGDEKTTVSGSLAMATRAELEEALSDLVEHHLVSRDQKGRFTIHPAIRDHFYRLFRDPSAVHQAVREHLIPLSKRPGIGLPSDKESLDLLEELVYHAIQAGTVREAAEIYMSRMGGSEHLCAQLGEYARTHRILSAFPQCPDATGMYHCLRALGKFREALLWRPNNRYLELLLGNLAKLSGDASENTRNMARFLRGENVRVPDRAPDSPLPSAIFHLYRHDLAEAERAASNESSRAKYGDDRTRNELVLCDIEARRGALESAKIRLDRASQWVLNSGSQELLCLMQLVRARVALLEDAVEVASTAVEEGLHIATECGFLIWHVELLIERAKVARKKGTEEACLLQAQEALDISQAPECRFAHGEAEALRLLQPA